MRSALLALLFTSSLFSTASAATRATLQNGSGNEVGTAASPIYVSGGGGSIGSAVAGGVANGVLYEDASQNLGAEAAFTYDSVTNILTAGTLSTSAITGTGAYSLDLPDSNITFLGTGDSINTAITAATAGDTLILAAGTYTITTAIAVSKSLTIIGQGPNLTTITTSSGATAAFNVQASNVTIKNLSITTSGATALQGIYFVGTGGAVLTNCNIENVKITMASAAGIKFGIYYQDSSGVVTSARSTVVSTDSNAASIVVENLSTAEAATLVQIFDSVGTSTAGSSSDTAYGVFTLESSATQDAIVEIYGGSFRAVAGSTAAVGLQASGGANSIARAYGVTLNGGTADVLQATSGSLSIYGCTLVNGTVSGTITYAGTSALHIITADGAITSSGNDLGWTVVDQTDNQACTTGCTSACVIGLANASGTAVTNLVTCADTTADLCVCAGSS